MKFISSLIFAVLISLMPAHAFTGWVCSEKPPKNIATPELPDQTEINKYKIVGDKLETVLDNRTIIGGTQMGISFVYQIITNNAVGLVAISTDAAEYDSGPTVFADVILIDKTRDTIEHFSGSTTGSPSEPTTGPCTIY